MRSFRPRPVTRDISTHLRRRALLLAVALFCAACASGDSIAEPLPTPVVGVGPTATAPLPTTAPDPTPTPVVLSDDDKIDAALAEFETDPPTELIAWDILDTRVADDQVTIELCSWTGADVYSNIYTATYAIQTNNDGTPEAINNGSGATVETCLNTELIDTALAATREYDTYWGSVLEDPTTFNFEQAIEILSPALADTYSTTTETWATGGLHWEGLTLDSLLPESSLQPALYRQFVNDEGRPVLQFAVCRQMNDNYGLYKDDVLFDDFVGPNARGSHQLSQYTLARQGQSWISMGVNGRVWSECVDVPDWLAGMNQIEPDPTEWNVLP